VKAVAGRVSSRLKGGGRTSKLSKQEERSTIVPVKVSGSKEMKARTGKKGTIRALAAGAKGLWGGVTMQKCTLVNRGGGVLTE